jgi:hypothetical protein
MRNPDDREGDIMRHLFLAALIGGLVLLALVLASAAHDAVPGLPGAVPVSYAVDNPAEPGDAFPTGPFSGGTD